MRLADPIDQATGLRRLFAGGSGFRSVGILGPDGRRNARACADLARGLGRRGSQVLVLDEARPPYNVGGMWGLLARYTLADVPRVQLAEAAVEAGQGIRLLAAPEALRTLASLNEQSLLAMAEHWGETPEWLLMNGRGGLQPGEAGLATTADIRVLVLPGRRDWLADTYAALKAAHAAWSGGRWMVLVEGTGLDAAQRLYHSLRETALRFLGFAPGYLGCLPSLGDQQGDGYGSLLAESLQAVQAEQPINFEQCWQRMWLFSRMTQEPVGGKGGNAGRNPG